MKTNTINLTFEKTNPETGDVFKRSETFVVNVFGKRADGSVDVRNYYGENNYSHMAWIVPSVETFEATWRERMESDFEAFCKRQRAALQTAADLRTFDEVLLPKLREALKGLYTAEKIETVARQAVEWHDAIGALGAVLEASPKEARKDLKGAYTAAREKTREEYSDDYAEAEDKDDFYEEFEDDIACYFAEELGAF